MKKILIAVAAISVALASCSKNEDGGTNPGNPNKISFANYNDKFTRAAVLDGTALKAQGFNVIANIVGNTDLTSFMPNVPITFSGGVWSSATDYFWPGNNVAVDFYAYSSSQTLTPTAAGLVSPVIAATAAAQDDIIVSEKESQASGTVSFTFNHVLSKVNFKVVCGEGVEVVINSFAIQGVADASASLDLTTGNFATPSAGAARTDLYTYGSGSPFPLTIAATDAGGKLLDGTAGAFMLLPQTGITGYVPNPSSPATGDGARIMISYKMKIDGVTIVENLTTPGDFRDAFFPLPDGSWDKGKSYLYTLTFAKGSGGGVDPDTEEPIIEGNGKILFDVAIVNGWDTDTDVVVPNN